MEDFNLTEEAKYLIEDFATSTDYYGKWLMYLNDLLIEEGNERNGEIQAIECLQCIKKIRDLLTELSRCFPKEDE